jgi:hypothetical protein
MRFTVEHRLRALERENIVLHDTIKLLHKLLKEQGELIRDYIARKIASPAGIEPYQITDNGSCNGTYTSVCRQKFDGIDKDIKKTLRLIENLSSVLKAN